MAQIMRCDRCRLCEVQVTRVLGHDLCVSCVAEFNDWVLVGQANARDEAIDRKGHGARIAQVRALCAAYGHCTTEMLAKAAGIQKKNAGWYLHSTVRQGNLVYHGKGTFTLPKRVLEAAE